MSHILARLSEVQNYSHIVFFCMFETALGPLLHEDKGCFRLLSCLNDPGVYQAVSEKTAFLQAVRKVCFPQHISLLFTEDNKTLFVLQ